jgi:hypothetical protein
MRPDLSATAPGGAPRFHYRFDPFRPGVSLCRLTSGAFAGMVGGLVLGVPFSAMLIADAQALGGPLSPGLFWVLHMAASTLLGMAFSLLVVPQSYRTSVPAALALVLGGAYGLGHLGLAMLGGPRPGLDVATAMELGGHALYGLALGVVYVAFHRQEVRDALAARDPAWQAWGRSEARAAQR